MIAVSAGHNKEAVGATYEDFSEFPETFVWAEVIVNILLRFGHEAEVVPTGTLGSKVRWINDNNAKLAIEIHFNSDPGHKGQGSETLFCPGSITGEKVADKVHRSYSTLLLPDRGIKPGWYRMDKPGVVDYAGDVDGDEKPDYFLRKTHCPAIIVEPEFIHNQRKIQTSRSLACSLIAVGLADAVKLC